MTTTWPPFTYCPDCGKKGVQFHFAQVAPGEDGYGCRYCDFFFFTALDMEIDRDNEARWKELNAEKIGGNWLKSDVAP